VAPLKLPRPSSGETVRIASSHSAKEGSVEVQIQKLQAVVRQRKSELRTLKAAARLARCEAKLYEVQIGNKDFRTLKKNVESATSVLEETNDYREKCLKHLKSLYTYSAGKMESERALRSELQTLLLELRIEEQKHRNAIRKHRSLEEEAGTLDKKLNKIREKNHQDLATIKKRTQSRSSQSLTRQEKTLIRSSMPHIWQKLRRMDKSLKITPDLVKEAFLNFAALEQERDGMSEEERTKKLQRNLQNLNEKLDTWKSRNKNELMHESEEKWDKIRQAQGEANASKVKYAWLTRKMVEMSEGMSALIASIAQALDVPDMMELPSFRLPNEDTLESDVKLDGTRETGSAAWSEAYHVLGVLKRALGMLLNVHSSMERNRRVLGNPSNSNKTFHSYNNPD